MAKAKLRKRDGALRPTRKDKALLTRRRVLRSAYERICEVGYLATTMDDIAARAEVSVQTLYFTFGTKAAILSEVLHAVVVGFDQWSPMLDHDVRTEHENTARRQFPWFQRFESEPDAKKALRIYVEGTSEILARVGPLLAAIGGRGLPEVDATLASSERLRAEASAMMVKALKGKGGLRAGLTVRRAVDVFHVLTSAEVFFQFTVGRGWTMPQAKKWLVDVLSEQLLPFPRDESADV